MTLFLYSAFLNIADNLEIELDLSASEHLSVLKSLHKVGATEDEKFQLLSGSFMIIGNLNSLCHLRKDAIRNVEKIISRLVDLGSTVQPIISFLTANLIPVYLPDISALKNPDATETVKKCLGYLLSGITENCHENSPLRFTFIDAISSLVSVYKNKTCKTLIMVIKDNIDDFITGLLSSFIKHNCLNYFELVEEAMSALSKPLRETLPIQKYRALLKGVYQKVIAEVEAHRGDKAGLADSSIVESCLGIFKEICKNKNVYDECRNEVDDILVNFCKILLQASTKDSTMVDLIHVLLKNHYVATKSNYFLNN